MVIAYRGREGMWGWVLHRLSGLGVVLFLGLHILDTALLGWGPEVYNAVMQIYHLPVVRVLEVVLGGAVLFHALNGIRVILIDFWDKGVQYQRQMLYVVAAVFVVSFVALGYAMLRPLS